MDTEILRKLIVYGSLTLSIGLFVATLLLGRKS